MFDFICLNLFKVIQGYQWLSKNLFNMLSNDIIERDVLIGPARQHFTSSLSQTTKQSPGKI